MLPGQQHEIIGDDIRNMLRSNGVQYDIAPGHDINSDEVIDVIRKRSERVFIFSGYGGVILKDKILLSAAILQIISLVIRNYQYSIITTFELYFSMSLSIFFIWLVLHNRNAIAKDKVK